MYFPKPLIVLHVFYPVLDFLKVVLKTFQKVLRSVSEESAILMKNLIKEVRNIKTILLPETISLTKLKNNFQRLKDYQEQKPENLKHKIINFLCHAI